MKQNHNIMKKSILVLLIGIAGLTSVNAQMTKGNLFIGTGLGAATYNTGNYNFNYSDGNVRAQDAKDFSLSVSPQMGVFLSDHLVFGGTLDLAYDHTKNNISNTTDGLSANNSTLNSTTFAIGPFLRYYFYNSPESKTVFYLQGDAAAGIGGGSTTQSVVNENGSSTYSNGSNSNTFVFRGGGGLGVTHFITKDIGLDFGVGYLYSYQKYTNNFTDQVTTAGGVSSSTPGSFKATVPQNGFSVSAGFHFFVK